MRKRNILFVTVNFPPNPSVGTKRVSKILKYLDHSKFSFFVLTLKEEYYNQKLGQLMGNQDKIPSDVKVFRTHKSDWTKIFTFFKRKLEFVLKNDNMTITDNKPSSKKQTTVNIFNENDTLTNNIIFKLRKLLFSIIEFPDKYIGWLPYALVKGIQIIRQEKIEIIFSTAPPHSIFLVAMLLKKITKIKLVLDFRDPWAISRWDKGNSVRHWFEKFLEKICIKNADFVLFVTPEMRSEYLKLYNNFPKEKFILFYNGFDPDDFKKGQENQREKIDNNFCFVHLGTLYKKRNPESLLVAVKNLMEKKMIFPEKLRFEFIGSVDTELKFVLQKVKKMGIEEIIIFKPPISFQESIATMLRADALLLIQPDTDLQIPAKLFEYMYIGKPILAIAEENSATHKIIMEGNLGILVPPNKIEAIEQAILNLVNKRFHFKPNSQYINQFNYKNYIKKLEKLLYEL